LLSEAQAAEILKPDDCGRVGFASYFLSNNNAEICRIKHRVAELECLRNSEPLKFENDDFSLAKSLLRLTFPTYGLLAEFF
jgi:hypothetical protein